MQNSTPAPAARFNTPGSSGLVKTQLLLLIAAWFSIAGCSSSTVHDQSFRGDLKGREADSSFVLVGDTQRTTFWERLIFREQNDVPREGLIKEIAGKNPAFVVLLGDIVDQGDDDREWRRFDEYATPLRESKIPIYAALGNHDYWGDRQTALENFFERFPHQKGATWTAVRFHAIAVILLNSNFSDLTAAEVREQDTWYAQQLAGLEADPSIAAILVGCHHPPYTNSMIVSDDDEVQQHFVKPFMAASKTAIFFTGHCHSYEHFNRDGKHFVVSGGGGGPRQRVDCSTARRHADLYTGEPIRPFNFCAVTIHADSLSVKAWMRGASDKEWSVGDAWGFKLHSTSVAAIL